MGDRPARSGDENPDSPLVFSVPASLQEYMSRYVDRPGERAPPPPTAAAVSPEPFPVRHWFDDRRANNNPADTRPAPSSTPLRAAAAAYEYNATSTAASPPPPPPPPPPPAATASPRDAANPAAGDTGSPMLSDYIAAWRAMSNPPLLGPVDSELEREGHQPPPPPDRRFQAAAYGGDPGTESDGGRVVRRRGIQARSASRGGRPQSSTEARRSGGGIGRGGTGGGNGSSGWSGESGGRVADVPFSPMNSSGRDHGGGSSGGAGGGGGGSVLSDVPRHWHNTLSGNNPANVPVWRVQGPPPPVHRAHDTVVGGVAEGNSTMSRGGSAQRGRRSLSDFLREIEEMVRAQREQQSRDAENLPTGAQASSQPYEGRRSRPLAAAAATMGAPHPQEYPMSGGDLHHPHVGGNARYLPPGERRWPTMTSHISHAATDSRITADATSVRAEAGASNHHPAVGGRQDETAAPFGRSTPAHTGGAGAPLNPAHTRFYPSNYVIPTLATTTAAAAGAMAGSGVGPEVPGAEVGPASHEGRPPTTARAAALRPPVRLSATATAFSMPPAAGTSSPDQPHETSSTGISGGGDAGSNPASEEPRTRLGFVIQHARDIVRREAERRRGLAIGRDGLAIGREGRPGVLGGVFAARARADQSVPAPAPPNSGASWALAQAGLGFAHGGRLQHGGRGPYLEVVPLTRMAELPPERGTEIHADGGAPSAAAGSDSDGAAGARVADDQNQGQSQSQGQSHLATLPAFRHWESQRARLRIQQWLDPNASPEPVGTESPASDGTMVLAEHLSSNGPSPRGGRPCFGQEVGGDDEASKVEEALFSCLVSLGVRRLLLEREGGAAARTRNHRTPAWLEEWLDGGARPHRIGCSGAGPSGYENRCPQVGDVWELLELLLGWWAERVCAVAVGFPMWPGQAAAAAAAAVGGAAGAARGARGGGVGTTGQQQRRGGEGGRQGGNGVGSLAGDAAATTQAVEAVQGLRKLGQFIMPLSRVRDFIGIEGGPTPRDAVLLKSLLVVHEGIAWAADRPHYRHYREEVIPTALKLYASLPQDVLEGVDLEVGHTLPERVFVMTGTARPSWPRWGGSPSAVTATTPSIEGERRDAPRSVAGSHGTGHAAGGGGGMGSRGERFIPGGPFNGSGAGGGMRCTGGWEGGGGGGGGRGGFLPGPWVVFRVAREEYLEFYRGQAAALDQAIGGSAVELEHLLM